MQTSTHPSRTRRARAVGALAVTIALTGVGFGATPAFASGPAGGTAHHTVDECIAANTFDPNRQVAVDVEEQKNLPPTKAELKDGRFTLVTHEKKPINRAVDSFPGAGLTLSDVYPGANVRVDGNLLQNRPTIIPVTAPGQAPFKSVTIGADLPGEYERSSTVNVPSPTATNGAVASILESWNATAAKSYPAQAARIAFSESLIQSKEQGKVEFGYGFTLPAVSANIDFAAIMRGEKQVYIASFQQVYYSIAANPPGAPSQWIPESDKGKVCGEGVVPGYVSNVDYGRQIYVIAETSSKSTEFKAAIKAAVQGHQPTLSTEHKSLVETSSVKAVVLGGGASASAKVVTGDVAQIRAVIAEGATFSRLQPAVPLNYTVKYHRDNSVATGISLGHYYETRVESATQGSVVINQQGGYVARYKVSWDEVTGVNEDGSLISNRVEWGSNGESRTAGASDIITLPANARNVSVHIEEATGLFWNPWRVVLNDKSMPLVNKRTITTGGTTLDPWVSNVTS